MVVVPSKRWTKCDELRVHSRCALLMNTKVADGQSDPPLSSSLSPGCLEVDVLKGTGGACVFA